MFDLENHLMSSIFKGKSYGYGDLCVGLDMNELHEPVYRQHSRRSDVHITLRPLSFLSDDEIITVCALLEWTKGSPHSPQERVDAERKVLKAIAESDAGQTFLGNIDDRAAFLTSVYKSLQHPISNLYPARESDYFLTLKMPAFPGAAGIDDLSLSVLQACLAHYFSYPPVEKILTRIEAGDLQENEEYENAGFRFLSEIGPSDRLYYHNGAGYLDR